MTQLQLTGNVDNVTVGKGFPHKLEDLEGWVIRYKDGTITRYVLDRVQVPGANNGTPAFSGYNHTPARPVNSSVGAWCAHTPDPVKDPVFETDEVRLFIADAAGARSAKEKFDIILDGGDVVTPYEQSPILQGDKEMVSKFTKHIIPYRLLPRVLRIKWFDRQDPDLKVAFWPEMAEYLTEQGKKKLGGKDGSRLNVLTVCQGGHGRSGSALTALMMCYTDYSPFEAIVHLRANHCPRAIESTIQHEYLDLLGKHLGRPMNAKETHAVTDFRATFMASKNPIAELYQGRLKEKFGEKEVVDTVKRVTPLYTHPETEYWD